MLASCTVRLLHSVRCFGKLAHIVCWLLGALWSRFEVSTLVQKVLVDHAVESPVASRLGSFSQTRPEFCCLEPYAGFNIEVQGYTYYISQGRANDWHWQWTLGIFWVHLGHRNHRNELDRSWQFRIASTWQSAAICLHFTCGWSRLNDDREKVGQGDKVWFAQFARLTPLLWGLILVIIQLLSLGLNRWADVVQTRNRGRTGGIRQAGNGWYDDLMTWKAVFWVQQSGLF